jgi:hypothetical protein
MGFGTAIRAFTRALRDREFSSQVQDLLKAKKSLPPPPRQSLASELLASLQREGRLVDFVQEDLDTFADAQVGAVARKVHQGCRKVFQHYLKLESVLNHKEGDAVTVESGFDPASIRLVGKVEGDPPFQGTLRHHGWKLVEATLPELKSKEVLLPAEVEL